MLELITTKKKRRYSIRAFGFIMLLGMVISCTTSKNTPATRAYHNLTSHYNVYFNANESLKSGTGKLKNNLKIIQSYFQSSNMRIPIHANLVSSDMDLAIKKCAKTIKSHSITVKPKTGKKGFSQKEKDFLLKADYCKWIDDAYLIMGKAHFYKREFETAKQTFLLNINKYSKEPSKDEAMLWLAKTYVETDDYKNAESQLN